LIDLINVKTFSFENIANVFSFNTVKTGLAFNIGYSRALIYYSVTIAKYPYFS